MNVKNQETQILQIKEFINSNEETIVINQVNENLSLFYMSILKYYADQKNIKLNIHSETENLGIEDDLFGLKSIKIFNITNTKRLSTILEFDSKKIIFTDYKNYKKLKSRFKSINGYQFETDITFFIQSEKKITNKELLYYCRNNPLFLFSEISKYQINNNYKVSDQLLNEEKNHILKIRKSIFEIKKNNFDIKNLYLHIKKEAEYKKLSFLTY